MLGTANMDRDKKLQWTHLWALRAACTIEKHRRNFSLRLGRNIALESKTCLPGFRTQLPCLVV